MNGITCERGSDAGDNWLDRRSRRRKGKKKKTMLTEKDLRKDARAPSQQPSSPTFAWRTFKAHRRTSKSLKRSAIRAQGRLSAQLACNGVQHFSEHLPQFGVLKVDITRREEGGIRSVVSRGLRRCDKLFQARPCTDLGGKGF